MRCQRLPQYNLVRGEFGNLLSWERRNCPKQPRLTTWRSTRDGSKLITTASETRTLGQRTLGGFCAGMAQLRVTPTSWGLEFERDPFEQVGTALSGALATRGAQHPTM